MSSVPIPAPTNTINPLPLTPEETVVARAVRPNASTSTTALGLQAHTVDAAVQSQNAQKADKAYREKKKCMAARKEWYDAKVHFAAGVQGLREGGKCVGRVVRAGPSLVVEKVQGGRGIGGVAKIIARDSMSSEDSVAAEKEKEKKKSYGGVKAKVAGLKGKLVALKEKRAGEKQAKADEKVEVVATGAAAVMEVPATAEATPASASAPAPAPTKQEKKRMTLDQVRERIFNYRSHPTTIQEGESERIIGSRITGWMTYFLPLHLLLFSLTIPSFTFDLASLVLDADSEMGEDSKTDEYSGIYEDE